jgi:hypothetical protein
MNNSHIGIIKYIINRNYSIRIWINIKNCTYYYLVLGNFIWRSMIISNVQMSIRSIPACGGGSHLSSLPMGPTHSPLQWTPGFFPGTKQLGHGVDHPPSSNTEFKERVELYFSSAFRPLWPVLGQTLLILCWNWQSFLNVSQANYAKYVSFPWPLHEAAVSVFNARLSVKNLFFEKNLIKTGRLLSMLNHKLSRNVCLGKICLVV